MQGKATVKGHPIHPMLVSFPIAFWVGSLIADILSFVTGAELWRPMATGLIAAGILSALLAAIAGFIDYLTAPMDANTKRTATKHLTLNLIIVASFAVNLYLRWRIPGIPAGYVLSVLAISALMYSGWLGGDLVYDHKVGVEEPADKERRKQEARRPGVPADQPARR
jgi:uncharacterized membrane protein